MRGIRIKLRKAFGWILFLAIIIIVIFVIRRYISSRGYESAVGSYITTGGQSYLVIEKGPLFSLHIEEGFFILNETIPSHASPVLKIHARFHENPTERTLEMIRELASRYPTDSWIRLHEVEQEALQGDVGKSEELWNKWEEENKNSPDTLLLKNAQHVLWIVSSSRFRKDYPDLAHYNDAFSRTNSLDLEDKKNRMLKLFDTGQIIYPEYPLVPHLPSPGYAIPPVPNFLDFQVTSKVLLVQAIQDLFLGKREENLRALAGLYLLSQSLRMDNTYMIIGMIGIAMQSFSIHGLTINALNACETKEDLEEFCQLLETLNRVDKAPMEIDAPYCSSPVPILSHTKVSGEETPNYLDPQTRSQVIDARFQLLRMAVAAKYNQFTTGDFPKLEKDFATLLSEGIPEDAFSEGKSLRYAQPSEDEFFVYSIGPDKTDDKAAFSYDPTNGTITPGDVYIRVPREREFPFPREGVKAKNAYQLLEQFPNGLPADPFADTRLRPFSIIESTETQPVVIFSFGPNTDEAEFTTHTIFSSKEIEGQFEPVPTPAPSPGASYGRSLQWVMRRSEEIPPPAGCWRLEPMYDPTNGATSDGDLFIEIPK
ncbi:hypothetical protein JW926_04935 [Candidatus Sumerlaeota bacterium]|nr:hypothetical protein [Candidatus Sumerlaeota bacterium]